MSATTATIRPAPVVLPASAGAAEAFPIRPRRDALAAAAIVCAVSVLGVGVLTHFAEQWQSDAVREELLQVARVAATRIDVSGHQALRRPEQELGEEYRRVVAPLVALLQSTDDVLYLYTAVLRNDRAVFVVDTATVHRRPGDTAAPSHLMEEYSGADRDLVRALVDQTEAVNATPQVDEFGHFLSAYAPLRDPTGRFVGIVGADMGVDVLQARSAHVRRIAAIAALSMCVLAAMTGVAVYRMRCAAAAAVERNARLLQDLSAARDLAEQSNLAKSTFLAMMSHELRTPLNAIVGFSELMHEELTERGQAQQAADVARVRTAGRHLAAIISDILDYSKVEAGRLVLAVDAVDVAALVAEVAAEVRGEAQARGLPLRVVTSPDAGQVCTDRERLRQVLLNLVGNAIKFTERGAVTVRARVLPGRREALVIAVHDTGPGIPAGQRRRLFQPFSQADGSATRRSGGTGLGLALSQRLVRLMGGSLRVRSRVGRGSTFLVTLGRNAPLEPRS